MATYTSYILTESLREFTATPSHSRHKLNLLVALMDKVPTVLAAFNAVPEQASVSATYGAMEALRVLLGLGEGGAGMLAERADEEERILFFHVVNSVRDVWEDLSVWIDYFNSATGRELPIDASTSSLSGGLLSVMRLKEYIPSRMESTPRVYRAVAELWFIPPPYVSTDLTRFVHWLAGLGSALQIVLMNVSQDGLDAIAVRQMLSAFDSRPNDLHRQAMASLRYFLTLYRKCDDRYAQQMSLLVICEHLSLIDFIVAHVVPLPCHARDVVSALVDVIRQFLELPCNGSQRPVVGACTILRSIWSTAADYRSVVWALNDGILDTLASLAVSRLQAEPTVLRDMLTHLGVRSILLPVTRALCKNDFDNLFGALRCAAFPRPIIRIISQRIALSRTHYAKACAYPECAFSGAELSIHRCACLRACYCSGLCQRQDWRNHKQVCNRGLQLSGHPHIIRGPREDIMIADFIALNGLCYVQYCPDKDLRDAHRLSHTNVIVDIDFNTMPPQHTTQFYRTDMRTDSRMLLTSTITRGIAGGLTVASRVPVAAQIIE